ncbi:MAG: hypothetical protein ABEK04_03410 [Candidatus Nanohalobium sp.]
MAKSQATISLDPDTWESAKRTYDNASERIQELLEADMDASKIEDEELIQKKINELEEEKESLEQDIDSLEKELAHVESELKAYRSSLEQARREEEEKQDDLAVFLKAFGRNYLDTSRPGRFDNEKTTWAKPEHIDSRWVEQLDMSKEELWEKGLEEVDE